jgi:hypothetical protein
MVRRGSSRPSGMKTDDRQTADPHKSLERLQLLVSGSDLDFCKGSRFVRKHQKIEI